jgi:hypothetical protein
MSYVVGGIADNVGGSIGWCIGRSVICGIRWSISFSIGSGIDRLHYFVFTSSLFSYQLKRTIAVTSLARTF